MPKKDAELAVTIDQLKVLSDPSRLQILAMLFDEERTLSQLAAAMDITPATVHHHMGQLLRAGLIRHTRVEVKGNLVEKYYTVEAKGVNSSAVWNELADADKVSYRLGVLGMIKGLVNQAIRVIQRRGTVDFEVGKVQFYRLPWRKDVLQQIDEILRNANRKFQRLHRKYEGQPGEKVILLITTLPAG
jgi:DNA-binding transcriptional ArsR family regulator